MAGLKQSLKDFFLTKSNFGYGGYVRVCQHDIILCRQYHTIKHNEINVLINAVPNTHLRFDTVILGRNLPTIMVNAIDTAIIAMIIKISGLSI